MNINDKISLINSRIEYNKFKLEEHRRILKEEYHLLMEGDEEVINNMIVEIQRIINALENAKILLSSEQSML